MGEAGLWSRPPYSFGFSMIRVYVIFSHPGHYLPVTPPNRRPGQKPQLRSWAEHWLYFPSWEHCAGKDPNLVTMQKS